MNPLLISFRRMLFLTSASERGALPLCFGVATLSKTGALPFCLGVVALSETLEVLPSVSKPSSSHSGSRTSIEVCSRLEQTGKITKGQELGRENKVALPFVLDRSVFKWLQAVDCRKDLAQSKVGDCSKRKEKKIHPQVRY